MFELKIEKTASACHQVFLDMTLTIFERNPIHLFEFNTNKT